MQQASTLRAATAVDQAFISEMQYLALFVPPGAAPFPRDVLADPSIARYHLGFGDRPGDVGVVAEASDRRPLGAAWARLIADGWGFVDDETPELGIAVIESARGRGIGTTLLRGLLARVPTCSLSVDDRNPALRLYERLGFRTVDRDGHHLVMLRT